MGSLTPIPETVSERSITSLGIHWPAADCAALPLDAGHVHVTGGTIPLSGIALAEQSMTTVELVDSLTWEEIDAAMFVHVETGRVNGEVLLLATIAEDGLEAVAVPAVVLPDEAGQPEFRAFLAHQLAPLVGNGTVSVVEDNLDRLLSYAGEFAQYAARDGFATQPIEPPGPETFDVTAELVRQQTFDYDSTEGWQNRKGSIFRHG